MSKSSGVIAVGAKNFGVPQIWVPILFLLLTSCVGPASSCQTLKTVPSSGTQGLIRPAPSPELVRRLKDGAHSVTAPVHTRFLTAAVTVTLASASICEESGVLRSPLLPAHPPQYVTECCMAGDLYSPDVQLCKTHRSLYCKDAVRGAGEFSVWG